MNEFMKTLFSLSVSGALLILLLLGLKQLYKNKFSRCWQYYIWIIAALRFLLPFTPDTTIVGSLFEIIKIAAINFNTTEFDAANVMNEPFTINSNAPVSINVDNTGAEPVQADRDTRGAEPVQTEMDNTGAEPVQADRDTTVMRGPVNIYVCLFFLWLVPALVLFIRKITVYQGFIQYIKAGSTEVSDIRILNLLSDYEEKLNCRKKVELFCNPLIVSPMLIGFFRPKIVLPVGGLGDKELSYIFMHELIHYKQKDMFYKWLIQVVVCVHWFNLFVYLLEKEVNKSCELSCDEKVISLLDDTARREYGDMLLSFLKTGNSCKNSLASVTLTEGAKQLKERLGAIMKFKKKSKVIRFITVICTLAVSFCFFTVGAYAAPSADNKGKVREDNEILNGVLSEKEQFTEEEKKLALNTVKKEENDKGYTQCTYMQRSYYSNAYIIEMGWNLNNKMRKAYPDSKEITLKDNSTIVVYFGGQPYGSGNGNVIEYMNDSNVLFAIGELIYSLKNSAMPNAPALETPLVTNITYVGERDLPTLAEEYYAKGSLSAFSAVFPILDRELQKEYLQKIYDDDNISFFAVVMPMDKDIMMLYADKAQQDGKMNFFYVLLPDMPSELINIYAEKYYEADNTSGFVIIIPYMSKSVKQEWLAKAQADKKSAFAAVLSDEIY